MFEVNIIFHRRTEHGAKAEEFVFVDDPIFLTTRIELVQKIRQGLERDVNVRIEWFESSAYFVHRLIGFLRVLLQLCSIFRLQSDPFRFR